MISINVVIIIFLMSMTIVKTIRTMIMVLIFVMMMLMVLLYKVNCDPWESFSLCQFFKLNICVLLMIITMIIHDGHDANGASLPRKQ